MSDLDRIGNLAAGMLFLGTVTVWWSIARAIRTGRPLLEYRPRDAPRWETAAPLLAVLMALLLPAQLLPRAEPDELWFLQRLCLISLLQIVLAFAILAAGKPVQWSEFGLETGHWREDLRVGTIGWLASLLPVYGLSLLVQMMEWREPDAQHPLLQVLLESSGWTTTAWVAVMAIVGAPFAEEFLFRVVLQGWLERHMHAWQAIVLSSLAFAAMHFAPGRPDYLPLFPLALILGYVYYRLHSYWAVATLHALFNATTFVLSLLEPSAD